MPPAIFFTGLPYNHHTLPGWGWPPERVKSGLEDAVGRLLKEGYDGIGFFVAPEQGIKVFEQKLLERKWDAVIIGWGVRGNPQLSFWLEELVNCIAEKSPGTKILFNWNPESTVDTTVKEFPMKEDDKAEMRAVFEKSGIDGRITYGKHVMPA